MAKRGKKDLPTRAQETSASPARLKAQRLEARGQAMLHDYLGGQPLADIALRYGATSAQVHALVMAALEDCIAAASHKRFRLAALQELTEIARELAVLDHQTPAVEYRSRQVLDRDGRKRVLRAQVSNVGDKVRLKAERRTNVGARQAVLAVCSGEQDEDRPPAPSSEVEEISRVLSAVAAEVIGERFAPPVIGLVPAELGGPPSPAAVDPQGSEGGETMEETSSREAAR